MCGYATENRTNNVADWRVRQLPAKIAFYFEISCLKTGDNILQALGSDVIGEENFPKMFKKCFKHFLRERDFCSTNIHANV